jgi:hypothetical protein
MKIRMLFILLLISAIGIFIIAYMFYDHILCLPGYVSGERTSAGPTDGYISQKICYKPYKDRGKICYQKDDCQGECIIPEEKVDELMVCLRQSCMQNYECKDDDCMIANEKLCTDHTFYGGFCFNVSGVCDDGTFGMRQYYIFVKNKVDINTPG